MSKQQNVPSIRKPQRMPRQLVFFSLFGWMILLATPLLGLEGRRAGDEGAVRVEEDEVIEETLAASGRRIEVLGTVQGNLLAAGQTIVVGGRVEGDVVAAGQEVVIEGEVRSNVVAFCQKLRIRGSVSGDVYGAYQELTIQQDARVGRDLMVAGAETRIMGAVNRDVLAAGKRVIVAGHVGRNVVASAGKILIADGAQVAGDVHAYVGSEAELEVSEAAVVSGQVKRHLRVAQKEVGKKVQPWFTRYIWPLVWIAAGVVTGLVLYWFLPGLMHFQGISGATFSRAAGVGFLFLVAAPVASVLVALTVVGLPLGLIVLAAWAGTLYLARVIVGGLVGWVLLGQRRRGIALAAIELLVGLIVLNLASKTPYVGWVVSLLVLMSGSGLLWTYLWRQRKQLETVS